VDGDWVDGKDCTALLAVKRVGLQDGCQVSRLAHGGVGVDTLTAERHSPHQIKVPYSRCKDLPRFVVKAGLGGFSHRGRG
jgi:hypothetical protein